MTTRTKIKTQQFVTDLLALKADPYTARPNGPVPEDIPPALADWLARLRLLYGVPFNYLVPHESLLPQESIRFFYIDRAFLDRLVDGALSVGKTGTKEEAHHHGVKAALHGRLDLEEQVYRRRLRSEHVDEDLVVRGELTGLLLRSAAVSGWTGLEVKAYAGADEKSTQLRLLRMDRLAPDILICIFRGVPQTVDIEEPREGLQFGFDMKPGGIVNKFDQVPKFYPPSFWVNLRHTYDAAAGTQVADKAQVQVPMRDATRRVVDVRGLRTAVAAGITAHADRAHMMKGASPNGSELAVQLLQFPYRQRFNGAGTPSSPIRAYTIQQIPLLQLQALFVAK